MFRCKSLRRTTDTNLGLRGVIYSGNKFTAFSMGLYAAQQYFSV